MGFLGRWALWSIDKIECMASSSYELNKQEVAFQRHGLDILFLPFVVLGVLIYVIFMNTDEEVE